MRLPKKLVKYYLFWWLFFIEIWLFLLFAAAPTYAESEYRANIVDKNDSQYMRTAGGQNEFAPRYPVFSGQALPPAANTQN